MPMFGTLGVERPYAEGAYVEVERALRERLGISGNELAARLATAEGAIHRVAHEATGLLPFERPRALARLELDMYEAALKANGFNPAYMVLPERYEAF